MGFPKNSTSPWTSALPIRRCSIHSTGRSPPWWPPPRVRRGWSGGRKSFSIHRYLGIDISSPAGEAVATGSTDANMGLVRGIPSISIGRSFGGNRHPLTEWADWKSALPATKMVLLLAVALSDGKPTPANLTPERRPGWIGRPPGIPA